MHDNERLLIPIKKPFRLNEKKERKTMEGAIPFPLETYRYEIGTLHNRFTVDFTEKWHHSLHFFLFAFFSRLAFLVASLFLGIENEDPTKRFVCMCVSFIWKCCIDSWINGMRGHAVCTAATIQETVEGNKTRCEFVRNQIEIEIGKGKRKMQ